MAGTHPSLQERARQMLHQRSRLTVLDGGLATELATRGFDLSDAPEAIEAVHLDYFEAGADIALTASYQASYEGFATRGLSIEDTDRLLQRSVRDLFVAASVEPYGATLPSLLEARALLRVLHEHPEARAWLTFTCRDESRTSAGDAIAECARWLDAEPQVVAMGVNCVDPALVTSLVRAVVDSTRRRDPQ